MLGCTETVLFVCEFTLLQQRISIHAFRLVGTTQAEHARVQHMPSGQRDELEFVTHLAQFLAEDFHGLVIEIRLPVE